MVSTTPLPTLVTVAVVVPVVAVAMPRVVLGGQPVGGDLQLLDLRALSCLDLIRQIGHPRVDTVLGQHHVAHLDRLLVVREHHLR